MSEWRPVVGYEGYYEVSSAGAVRALAREVWQQNRGGKLCRQIYGAREMPRHQKRGYAAVRLTRDNYARLLYVHQLVAAAFIGPRPEGMEVCHGDGDRMNAALSNLQYGTPKENGEDRVRHGRSRPGSQHHFAKISEADALSIRAMEGAISRSEIARAFNLTPHAVRAIQRRVTWRHV
jgi:hypothetical protein